MLARQPLSVITLHHHCGGVLRWLGLATRRIQPPDQLIATMALYI
jgi:hypothetical protein